MGYTTDELKDWTFWYRDGQGFDKEFSSWEDDQRLGLAFNIIDGGSIKTAADDYTRCLACLNVDENSEVWNGDTGFAACWKAYAGNVFDDNGEF